MCIIYIDIHDSYTFLTDGAVLIQPMANQAQSASARSKPHLVEVVAGNIFNILSYLHI